MDRSQNSLYRSPEHDGYYKSHDCLFQVTNAGDGYSNRDGIFDAPVSGLYVVVYTLYGGSRTELRGKLIVDGQVKTASVADGYNGVDYVTPTTVIVIVIHVNAGERVFVRRAYENSGCLTISSAFKGWSSFTG